MHESEYAEKGPIGRSRTAPVPPDAVEPVIDLPSQLGNREFSRHISKAAVQRSGGRSQGSGPLDPEIEADIRAAQGGGRPLDDVVRGDMESHLGVDLSAVRVHADSGADTLSWAVQADAFTTGTDVFFRAGHYSPESGDGRKLLAHELTHVVQQTSGGVPAESRVSHPNDAHEVEARVVADSLSPAPTVAPSTARAGDGTMVQRQASDQDDEKNELEVSRQESPAEEEDLGEL